MDRYHPRVKGWKNIFQANGPKKQAGVATLISDKIIEFKVTRRDWERYYVLKGKTHHETIAIFFTNTRAPKFIKYYYSLNHILILKQ